VSPNGRICLEYIRAVKLKKKETGTQYELYGSHNDVDEKRSLLGKLRRVDW